MALFKKKKKKEEAAEGEEKEGEEKKEEAAEEPKEEAKEGEAAEGEGGGEGGEGEGGEGAAPKKKSKKKIIIIGILALVVLIGGAAGAYFGGLFGKEEEVEEGMEIGPDGKPIAKVVYYTLPEFLVNLSVGGKQTSFLKTTIILELSKASDVGFVESNLPRVLDGFNTYLRELRASDLAGSAGIQRLREELLLRANKALEPAKVNDVLFKEIVVQ